MITVYLDANVYNDAAVGKPDPDVIKQLMAARQRGDLRARLGLIDLEESLGLWRHDPAGAINRLRFAQGFAGFDNLLGQPFDLLAGAIQAYASGASAPSSLLLPRTQRKQMADFLETIIRQGSPRADGIVSKVLEDVKVQKESFVTAMTAAKTQSLDGLLEKYCRSDLRRIPFTEFFDSGVQEWAFDFAAAIEVADACRARGLDGLAADRTVRLFIGTVMSIVHSMICDGRELDFGDKYDLWHAILASAADVFVTNDKRLFAHVSRIPDVAGFQVVRSLGELLAAAT